MMMEVLGRNGQLRTRSDTLHSTKVLQAGLNGLSGAQPRTQMYLELQTLVSNLLRTLFKCIWERRKAK